MSTQKKYTFDNAEDFIGQELGVSEWLEVRQENINAFGHVS